MTEAIATEIQAEQERGRAKYGNGPHDTKHDDGHMPVEWVEFIRAHNEKHLRLVMSPKPELRRAELVKIAGLAVSAIEAFDRQMNVRRFPGDGIQ